MSRNFDVVVIGGGPAGYIGAIRASQHGMKVACIDQWVNRDGSNAFGGTCLNAGCIPSKVLLESSELFHRAQHEFARHGIRHSGVTMDIATMQGRKSAIVRQLTGGIAGLFKAGKVEGLVGHGKLLAGKEVEFRPVSGKAEILEARYVILASGSAPIELPVARFDGERIVDSWGALDFTEVPQRLGVIGAGVIGLELSRADFYAKELSFQVSCSYGPGRYDPAYEEQGQDYPLGFVRWTEQRNFEAVLDLMASGALSVAPLITHRFSVEAAAEAYSVIAGREASLGVLLRYPTITAPPQRMVRLAPVSASTWRRTASALRVLSIGYRVPMTSPVRRSQTSTEARSQRA